MFDNIFYIILSVLGLGFLVLIHEWGHYFMARRAGMNVEVFSIGFGPVIASWKRDGVKWQVCWLPFGGYVRIAGMEKKGRLEPHQIPDGFYGKKPLARIKVAIMGPLVNIVFALFAFTIIWTFGGRDEPFAKHTSILGWVDPGSPLAKEGLRAGDRIETMNGRTFHGFQDLVLSSIMDDHPFAMQFEQINYFDQAKKNLQLQVDPKHDLKGFDRLSMTVGVLAPAQYLVYDPNYKGGDFPIRAGAPMAESGINAGDRIAWVNGQLIFSLPQLSSVINAPQVLITVQRDGEVFLTSIPRLKVGDVRFQAKEKDELDDWRHALSLKNRLSDLFYIPYNISKDLVVEESVPYVDEVSEPQNAFKASTERSTLEIPLQNGDRILAVDGISVQNGEEFLNNLQTPKTLIIVERGQSFHPISWKKADNALIEDFSTSSILSMISSVGTEKPIMQTGRYVLLNPVTPVHVDQFPLTEDERKARSEAMAKQKDAIQAIENPEERDIALRELQKGENRLLLGIRLHDREVIYNPSPLQLTKDVFIQTWQTFSHLFTGSLSPKWIAGPVGIMQIMQHGWSVGFKEALYWMGLISMNLAILNLLPVPVFDGGHICFSAYEAITKKRIKSKTMEKMILPFIVLLIILFIYLTYNDLLRLVQGLFS